MSEAIVGSSQADRRFGWVILAGWLALAVPSFWDFMFGQWSAYSQGHEMLLLAVVTWLMVRQHQAIQALPEPGRVTVVWASLGLTMGLLAYVLGRTQEFIRIELLAVWWVALTTLLVCKGMGAFKRTWFIWLFALFIVPMPFSVVLSLTAPLKEAVSAVATWVLSGVGYPVGRTGVVITVGQYQLLVAEACAGLHSMFILEAMGLLYSYLMNHASWWRNGLLAALAVPVSFAANVVRVMVLVVVTYHFGDATGQGFVHHFAGVVLFAVALALMAGLDLILGWIWPDPKPALPGDQAEGAVPSNESVHVLNAVRIVKNMAWQKGWQKGWQKAGLLALAMLITAVFSAVFVPRSQALVGERASVPLEQLFPSEIADWRLDRMAAAPVRPAFERGRQFQMYDQVLERTYVNPAGYRIMLSVAYGRQQSVGLQMHRPEVCYKAGGFHVSQVQPGALSLSGHSLAVTRLFASMEGRPEPITYWRLMGDEIVADEAHFKWRQLSSGLLSGLAWDTRRVLPDGMLVRVSSIDGNQAQAYRVQAAFIVALAAQLNPLQKQRVMGWR